MLRILGGARTCAQDLAKIEAQPSDPQNLKPVLRKATFKDVQAATTWSCEEAIEARLPSSSLSSGTVIRYTNPTFLRNCSSDAGLKGRWTSRGGGRGMYFS